MKVKLRETYKEELEHNMKDFLREAKHLRRQYYDMQGRT